MRNLVASFISLQALLTLMLWVFVVKAGGIYVCFFPALWSFAAIQIVRLAFKRSDFDVIVWWFGYFDLFLATNLVLLILFMPIFYFLPIIILPGVFLSVVLTVYISEKTQILRKPVFDSLKAEIFFKITANLPIVLLISVSSLGA